MIHWFTIPHLLYRNNFLLHSHYLFVAAQLCVRMEHLRANTMQLRKSMHIH